MAAPEDPTELVNPFIGTENFGNTFPGASMPFGMVQVSPDNGGQGGYDYKRDYIHGFSQTHLSGVGCGVVGELPMMPTTGDVSSTDQDGYRSTFSHANEQAEPGYYRVHLDRYDIDVELTATTRTGWQRYTFPATGKANVLFNTARANMGVQGSHVEIKGDDTVEGWVASGGFCAGRDAPHATSRRASTARSPRTAHGRTARSRPARTRSENGSGKNGAWVTFDTSDDRRGARQGRPVLHGPRGRAGEPRRGDGATGTSTPPGPPPHDRWEQMLHKVEITGGDHDRRVAFYTALYHALMHPNSIGDVDGSYMGFDGQVHKAADYTPMANFSLWDTYRPQNQLLELLTPDRARDVALSLLAVASRGRLAAALGARQLARRTS